MSSPNFSPHRYVCMMIFLISLPVWIVRWLLLLLLLWFRTKWVVCVQIWQTEDPQFEQNKRYHIISRDSCDASFMCSCMKYVLHWWDCWRNEFFIRTPFFCMAAQSAVGFSRAIVVLLPPASPPSLSSNITSTGVEQAAPIARTVCHQQQQQHHQIRAMDERQRCALACVLGLLLFAQPCHRANGKYLRWITLKNFRFSRFSKMIKRYARQLRENMRLCTGCGV